MVETAASIRLTAIDTNVVSTINEISTQATNATLATTVLAASFGGLEKASRSSQVQMALGAQTADKLAKSFSKVADVNSKLTRSLGAVGNIVFFTQQMAVLGAGLTKASEHLVRLPQTLQAMQASGVMTRSIEDFASLAQAIKGSDLALESLVVNSISELSGFESAAARAGTILKSSTRLNEVGLPDRANAQERLQNALSTQEIVDKQLGNAVTSTEALLGQYEVLSAGFTSAEQSQEVLSSGLKLIGIAEAGGVRASPTETLQLLTKTLNAYELSSADAAKTAGILNAVVENGLTTIPQLSLGFGAMAKQARQANIALEDSAASVSVLTSQGISTPEALTGISRLSANIINKTPEAEEALSKLQIRGEKIRFDKAEIQAKGFTQALVDLNEAAGGSAEVLAKVFPEDVAFRTANALLAEQGKRLTQTTKTIKSATAESLEEVFEIAQSDRTKRFQRLANRFKEIIIKIGLALADTIEPGLAALEKIANQFANLPDPIKKAIGSFLAFRIATKSAKSALGELVKTLISLATNYLAVRLISLALTGQLGKEFQIIKSLITQRKGLAAATLQLFGINQKWRLSAQETTEAMIAQEKAVGSVSRSVSRAAKGGVASFTSRFSGITKEEAAEQLQRRKEEAVGFGQRIYQGYVKPLSSKAKQAVKSTAIALDLVPESGEAKALTYSAIPALQKISPPTYPYPLIPGDRETLARSALIPTQAVAGYAPALTPTAKPIYTATAKPRVTLPKPKAVTALPGLIPQAAPAISAPLVTAAAIPAYATLAPSILPEPQAIEQSLAETSRQFVSTLKKRKFPELSKQSLTKVLSKQTLRIFQQNEEQLQDAIASQLSYVINRDRDVLASSQAKSTALAESRANHQTRQAITGQITQQQKAIEKADIDLYEARNKALEVHNDLNSTAEQKQKSLQQITKKEQALKHANLKLADSELKYQNLNTEKLIHRNQLLKASTDLEAARAAASKRFLPLAESLVKLEEGQSLALKASEAAKVASLKVETLTQKLGAEHAEVLIAKTEATMAEKKAIQARAIATHRQNAADKIANSLLEKQSLAERGLYKARLFGNDVVLVQTGLIGALNKVLTTNVSKNVQLAISEANLAKVRAFFTNPTDLRSLAIWAAQLKLLSLNVSSLGKNIGNVLSVGLGKAKQGAVGLLGSFGAIAPLVIAAAGAAVILRNEFFGLGAETRKLSKTYQEFLKEQKKLNDELGRTAGIASLSRLAEGEADTDKFRNKLISLKDSGSITSQEFNRLSKAINEVGSSGSDSKEKLEALRRELNEIALSDGKKIEKGVIHTIGGAIKSIPGFIGSLVDFSANVFGAMVGSLDSAFREGRLTGFGETALAREFDLLVKPFSELDAYSEKTGRQFLETTSAIVTYRDNLALTSEAQEKVARGERLTTEDLKQEDIKFKNLQRANTEQIQAVEKRLKEDEDALQKVRKEEAKTLYRNRIEQARNEKEALEEQNEAYKQLRSQIQKYLTEELPQIRRALQEQSNPALALKNAQEAFEQAYLKDSEGRTTKLLKPLSVLRDEAFKLAAQIQENLQLGVLDQEAVGEQLASQQLRELRDNQIEFMENGELKRGYRLAIADRRAFTEQIIKLENTALTRAESRRNIEMQIVRDLGQAQLDTQTQTNLKLAMLQEKQLQNRIQQKQREVDEYREAGLRTIEIEIQLEQLQAQARAQNLKIRRAELQQQFAEAELRFSQISLRNEQAIASIEQRLQTLRQAQAIDSQDQAYLEQQLALLENIREAQASISANEVYNADIRVSLSQERLMAFEQTLPYQEIQLEREIEINRQQQQQNRLQAQQRIEQSLLNADRAKQNLYFAQANEASAQQLETLELALNRQLLQTEAAKQQLAQVEFEIENEAELSDRKREQFYIQKQLEASSLSLARSQALRAQEEAKISRQLQLQNFALDSRKQTIQVEQKADADKLRFRTGELSLASQLTNKESDKLKIAAVIAKLKLNSLQTQLRSEAQILAINQQQEQIQLRAEKSKNVAALSQNLADIIKAQAQVQELSATGASAQQIQAAQLQVEAAIAQRNSLQLESVQLKEREKLQKLSQAQARESLRLSARSQIDQLRVESIQALPESRRQKVTDSIRKELLDRAGVLRDEENIVNLNRNKYLERIVKSAKGLNLSFQVQDSNLDFPDIRKTRESLAPIFSQINAPTPSSSGLTVQTLNLESPINIEISGAQDKEEIAEQVESTLFNKVRDVFKEVEQELN